MAWKDPEVGNAAMRMITVLLTEGNARAPLVDDVIEEALAEASAKELLRATSGLAMAAISALGQVTGQEPVGLLQGLAARMQLP